jgi:hypothetical protein
MLASTPYETSGAVVNLQTDTLFAVGIMAKQQ